MSKRKPEPFCYTATCIRVIDGDTYVAMVDLGFSIHRRIKIRLYGADAWESRCRDKAEKVKGLKAKARVKDLLEGQTFLLRSHGVGKFGRCLADVFVGPRKQCLASLLVKEKHAYVYHGENKAKARKRLS